MTSLAWPTIKTRATLGSLYVVALIFVTFVPSPARAAEGIPPTAMPQPGMPGQPGMPPEMPGQPGMPPEMPSAAMPQPGVASAQPAPPAPPAQAPGPLDDTWLVKKGDTLERIVSRRLASLPFKPNVVRKALVDKNPEAFKDAKARKLTVGSTLKLPTLEDFRYLFPGPAPAPPQPAPPEPAMPQPAPPEPAMAQPGMPPSALGQTAGAPPSPAQAEADEDPRKGWIKYP